jgi:hypothetical protein
MTLTSTSILATVMLDTDREHILSMVTIYVAFSIPGLLNIIIFYTRRDLLPRHSQSFCLGIAFLVEYLAVSAEEEEDIAQPFHLCLLSAIIGCLMSSVLMIISSSSMTTFSLTMFTCIQGTWLIHAICISCCDKMSYIYFSWHVLAVFIITLVINVIMQLQAGTQVKKHMVAKHTSLSTTVDRISDVYSETNTGLTVVTNSEAGSEEEYKEVIQTENKTCNVYKNYKVDRKLKEELEIDNVLETIDKMVKDQASKETENTNYNIIDLREQNDKINNNNCERLSPLEEFNTLHRHVSGVRASIKLKESDIV